jgi:putative PIN family toxin of toxin-antitoxin system
MVSRFVFDTNSWVSLFYRDKYLKLVAILENNEIEIFSCRENFSEFRDVHSKHPGIRKLLPSGIEKYTAAIDEICEFYEPQKRYALLNDYKDNYLIDLAHQTKSVLVTNDRHFDSAKKLRRPKVKIITIQEFYKLMEF